MDIFLRKVSHLIGIQQDGYGTIILTVYLHVGAHPPAGHALRGPQMQFYFLGRTEFALRQGFAPQNA